MGRVIATPLHNLAMPLIRYDVGDYAEFGEPCPCGRGLPVLRRIMGRSRNLLRLPSGERIFPYFHDGLFREITPVRQFQVVQTHLQKLGVRLVTERPLTRKEEEAIRALVQDRTSQSFEIKLSYHESIPQGPGGKYQDFICEIETGPDRP
jgi:phenylacetate-CoA ligase